MSTIFVGRLRGLELRIHVSWVIILALIGVTVAAQMGSVDPSSSQVIRWGVAVAVALGFLLSAVAHEMAHALVARRAGAEITTVIVYFLGAAASPELETARPRDEIAAAAAGPLVSIVIGLVLLAITALLSGVSGDAATGVATVTLVVGTLDVALGLLNLLPAYPLDGGRIVRAIAWRRSGDPRAALRTAGRVGRSCGIVVAALGVLAIFVADPLDGLMIALGGWFLVTAARGVERRALVDAALEGVIVRDIMDTDPSTVPPGLTIDTFADQVLGGSAAAALPVMRGTELVGLVGIRQLRRVRHDRWSTMRVEDVMVSPPMLPILRPDDTIQTALDDLARSSLDGLPVMEGGVLTGLVTRGAVAERIRSQVIRAGILPW